MKDNIKKTNLDLCNVLFLLLGSQGYALTCTLTGADRGVDKGGLVFKGGGDGAGVT